MQIVKKYWWEQKEQKLWPKRYWSMNSHNCSTPSIISARSDAAAELQCRRSYKNRRRLSNGAIFVKKYWCEQKLWLLKWLCLVFPSDVISRAKKVVWFPAKSVVNRRRTEDPGLLIGKICSKREHEVSIFHAWSRHLNFLPITQRRVTKKEVSSALRLRWNNLTSNKNKQHKYTYHWIFNVPLAMLVDLCC
jgi:hypothetical protein